MQQHPTVIVLAAGQGRRYGPGQGKLTELLGPYSLLAHTLRSVLDSGLPALVVTTAALAEAAANWVARRDVLVLPGGAAAGMAGSLAAGVAHRATAPGWLALPADMPLVRPESLRAVALALRQHPVAVAAHRGVSGGLLGFAAELYSELVQLRGESGAQRLLARYPARRLELPDPGVVVDVDTAADLQHLRRRWSEAATPPAC